jgi:steroid 5-alpha reductase family enzyme
MQMCYQANAIPPTAHPPLNIRDYASLTLFGGSFLLEVVADRQKSAWRKAKDAKQHDEKFITSGLWGISRHPK